MKLQLNQIINFEPALKEEMSKDNKDITFKTRLKLSLIFDEISKEKKSYDKTNGRRFKDLGVELTDGTGRWQLKQENIKQYQSELDEILMKEIDVNIELLTLKEVEEIKMKAMNINVLKPIISDYPKKEEVIN